MGTEIESGGTGTTRGTSTVGLWLRVFLTSEVLEHIYLLTLQEVFNVVQDATLYLMSLPIKLL